MSVPVARSISRPCASARVCRKAVCKVFRLSRYLSSGVGPLSAAAEAAAASNTTMPRAFLNIILSRYSESIMGRRRHEHFARAVRLELTDDAGRLHAFQQPRGAVVADFQTSLHIRDRGLALGGDDFHRLIVQRILLDGV